MRNAKPIHYEIYCKRKLFKISTLLKNYTLRLERKKTSINGITLPSAVFAIFRYVLHADDWMHPDQFFPLIAVKKNAFEINMKMDSSNESKIL